MIEAPSVSQIKLTDDVYISVPASTSLMTPYILQEQQQWFEEELSFLRSVIKPGMKVIDIGANYGVYTLPLASMVGTAGKIWAFEPAAATAAFLYNSIDDNGLSNIELFQAGLSNSDGERELYTCPNSEWNSFHEIATQGVKLESVKVQTLDQCYEQYDWQGIEFIKLDAEGEESQILEGGKEFLVSESPLIMYEFKHNEYINSELINAFKQLGYDSYRYVPGLNVLVPFDPAEPVDVFLLNLFACKKPLADELETAGLLARSLVTVEAAPDLGIIKAGLGKLPYWDSLGNNINVEPADSSAYLESLAYYLQARTQPGPAKSRYSYLKLAYDGLKSILEQGEERIEYLVTFSRIAFDIGERGVGNKVLALLISKYYDDLDFVISEPLLPAAVRYEAIVPENTNAWLIASILEQFIIKHAYSTFFSKRQTLVVFTRLEQLGYLDEAMSRRKDLIESVFPE